MKSGKGTGIETENLEFVTERIVMVKAVLVDTNPDHAIVETSEKDSSCIRQLIERR